MNYYKQYLHLKVKLHEHSCGLELWPYSHSNANSSLTSSVSIFSTRNIFPDFNVLEVVVLSRLFTLLLVLSVLSQSEHQTSGIELKTLVIIHRLMNTWFLRKRQKLGNWKKKSSSANGVGITWCQHVEEWK